MTVWTPVAAMAWEAWRLSRRGLAVSIVLSSIGGGALLASPMSREQAGSLVLQLVVVVAYMGGARWPASVDERKGFTFSLGYTRPVVTWTLVAVPLSFVAASAAVAYLVPAALFRGLFGVPFPLLPVAAICAAASLVWVASTWWTADLRARRIAGGGLTAAFVLWYYEVARFRGASDRHTGRSCSHTRPRHTG